MRFVQPSAAKLNLSLRVVGKRGDGYHDIVSSFLRLPPVEALFIETDASTDSVGVRGMDVTIDGENIVARALRCARDERCGAPFLKVEIAKSLYPGSGLGAGSGNGAAVLRWLAGNNDHNDEAWQNAARKTGADVPFLFSNAPFALVSGIGEVVEPLPVPSLRVWVAFPEWGVGTENAYGQLDRRCGGIYPLNEGAAREEAERLRRKLEAREHIGLLPNDFAPFLMEKFPDYDKLFGMFARAGSSAWGITGSGGGAFALFYDASPPYSVAWPAWVRQVLSADVG